MNPLTISHPLQASRRLRPFVVLLAACAVALWAPASRAATATVGPGLDCSHSSLRAAVAFVESADDGPHVIRVTSGTYRETATITIRESLTIASGYSDCFGTPNSGYARLELNLNDALFRIEGPATGGRSRVEMSRLGLVATGSYPAGFRIQGPVDVQMNRVGLAGLPKGGVLIFANDAGSPTLKLDRDAPYSSVWETNGRYTTEGGAISCWGANVELHRVTMRNNQTSVDGGAVGLHGCDLLIGTDVEFADNVAGQGGGAISAKSGSRVWTDDSEHVWGRPSFAAHGAFLFASESTVAFRNTLVGGDQFGGAAGTFHVTAGSTFDFVSTRADCQYPQHGFCASFGWSTSSGKGGGLLLEDSLARIVGARIAYGTGSQAGGAVHVENGVLELEGVLITGNTGASILSITGDEATRVSMRYVTLTDNDAGLAPIVVESSGGTGPRVEILSSILWEIGSPVLYAVLGGGGAPDVHCLLASSTLSGTEVLVGQDPEFVDPGLDYHLSLGSPAIDFCDGSRAGRTFADQDGEVRGADQPGVGDRSLGSSFDLGADEVFGESTILFEDGFESGDLSGWN